MIETFDIAGYTRISVDDELDQKNISIENQKAIIEDFVKQKFPGSSLTFYEDRDRSGYTFEQREGYQAMRKKLVAHQYDILIVKDFSRFSRRNSRGLVELEDLRDAGVRIISGGRPTGSGSAPRPTATSSTSGKSLRSSPPKRISSAPSSASTTRRAGATRKSPTTSPTRAFPPPAWQSETGRRPPEKSTIGRSSGTGPL